MPATTLLMMLSVLAALPSVLSPALHAADPWLVEHQRPQAPHPISLKSLTDQVLAPMHQDGTADLVDLESMLKGIQADVASHLVLRDPAVVADAAERDPLAGNGWRLWTFWTMAEPDLTGLVSALVRVRGSGLASQRIIHLASLRKWEEMTFRCNTYRETMMAAAKVGDLERSRGILAAWKDWLGETNLFLTQFHHQGIGVLSDPTAARVLRVETTPCFRLISPSGRIHTLDGFGPAFDLVAWIAHAQDWEADYDRRHPGRTP